MRISTGLILIILLISLFSYSFIGVINEFRNVQTIDDMLKNSIQIDDFQLNTVSYMYDQDGNIFSEIYSSEKRIYLPYSQIPDFFLKAMVATEDRHFYTHKGFDFQGIIRALFINAEKKEISQGASTITQQLIKNIYLSNERSYNRKLTEILYAYKLEKMFPKEKILELYLNVIYFNNGVYGIEAASQYYFSKSAKELSLAEVAYLCAIPNNPTIYNPITNPENTNIRKQWILSKMFEENYISETELQNALSENIAIVPSNKIDNHPAYSTYIHFELEQLIGEKEGFNDRIALAPSPDEKKLLIEERRNRLLELLASGISIYTALHPEKQRSIHKSIATHLPEHNIQGAVAIINQNTNEIIALSGGKNFKKFDFHRGFQAFRQPGSAIKPLLVYGPYLSEKNVPNTSVISAAPFCKNGFCPQNYGGAKYGNTTIENALKHSFNTTAVRMLDNISIEKGFNYFTNMGFSKIVDEDHRLPAALGGLTLGVSLLELTNAYTIFGNDGVLQNARAIKKVVDSNGNIIFEWAEQPKPIWSKEVNDQMRTMLTKVVKEGTARKANFHSPYIGGKTGTSNDFHDLWFVGLNENYTVGVWIGEDIPKSLAKINARSPHLLIWRDLMK